MTRGRGFRAAGKAGSGPGHAAHILKTRQLAHLYHVHFFVYILCFNRKKEDKRGEET